MADPLLEIRDLHVEFSTFDGTVNALNGVSLTVGQGETLGLVGESGSGKSVHALAAMGCPQPPRRVRAAGRSGSAARTCSDAPAEVLRRLRGERSRWSSRTRCPRCTRTSRSATRSPRPTGCTRTRRRRRPGGARSSCSTASGSPSPRRGVALSARAVRRHAPARRDRDGARLRPGAVDRRRADDRARRHGAGPDPRPDRRPPARARHRRSCFITHDLGVVAEVADQIAVMYAGRVVEQGPADDVFDAPRHPYTLGAARLEPAARRRAGGRLPSIPGSPPSPLRSRTGCAFHPRCAYARPAPAARAARCCRGSSASATAHVVACHLRAQQRKAIFSTEVGSGRSA